MICKRKPNPGAVRAFHYICRSVQQHAARHGKGLVNPSVTGGWGYLQALSRLTTAGKNGACCVKGCKITDGVHTWVRQELASVGFSGSDRADIPDKLMTRGVGDSDFIS